MLCRAMRMLFLPYPPRPSSPSYGLPPINHQGKHLTSDATDRLQQLCTDLDDNYALSHTLTKQNKVESRQISHLITRSIYVPALLNLRRRQTCTPSLLRHPHLIRNPSNRHQGRNVVVNRFHHISPCINSILPLLTPPTHPPTLPPPPVLTRVSRRSAKKETSPTQAPAWIGRAVPFPQPFSLSLNTIAAAYSNLFAERSLA